MSRQVLCFLEKFACPVHDRGKFFLRPGWGVLRVSAPFREIVIFQQDKNLKKITDFRGFGALIAFLREVDELMRMPC